MKQGDITWATQSCLGVCPPLGPDGNTLVAFHLVLPMGWVESPPQFCAVTETVADIANTALRGKTQRLHMPHLLDQVSESTVPGLDSPISGHLDINHNRVVQTKGALAYTDIFVDDLLGITQGNKARQEEFKRPLLHSLDNVLRPLLANGPAHAPRLCITEKDEAGRQHVGNAKNTIGLGY